MYGSGDSSGSGFIDEDSISNDRTQLFKHNSSNNDILIEMTPNPDIMDIDPTTTKIITLETKTSGCCTKWPINVLFINTILCLLLFNIVN